MTQEEAISLLNNITSYCDFEDEYGDMIDSEPYYEAVDLAIKALEQEPKIGHWSDECECSVCGNQPWYEGSTFRKNYKFCPYCGAEMESEDEE